MRYTTAALFMLLCANTAFAQKSKGKEADVVLPDFAGQPYRLVYDHVTATFTLYDDDGEVKRGWRDVPAASARMMTAPVPPNRPLEVVVTNANSLVYDYSFGGGAVNSPRVRACRDLGRDFLSQTFFTTTRSIMGAEKPIPSLDAVLRDVKAISEVAEEGFGFGGSERAAALDNARISMVAYRKLTTHLMTLAETLDDSLENIATRADAEPIDSLIDSLVRNIEREYPGLADPRLTPVVVSRAYRDINALLTRAAAGANDAISSDAKTLSAELNASTAQTNKTVKKVQQTMLRLARARAESRQSTMLVPAETGRQIVISIDAVKDSERFGVLPVREGEVTAYTRPAAGMLCQLSVGLNWTRPGAAYKLDRSGVITDETSDAEIRTAPAVFFSFGPAFLPQVGVLGGIGLGEGGRPDLYLGGSVRVLAPLLINAGAMWQREQVLPSGLRVGDTAPESFDDFDRQFKPSFFFGLSFGR